MVYMGSEKAPGVHVFYRHFLYGELYQYNEYNRYKTHNEWYSYIYTEQEKAQGSRNDVDPNKGGFHPGLVIDILMLFVYGTQEIVE